VIQNFKSGRRLDVFEGSLDDLAPVIQFQPNGLLNHQWRFINSPFQDGESLCNIVSVSSGTVPVATISWRFTYLCWNIP
jgi:hypothetical protein